MNEDPPPVPLVCLGCEPDTDLRALVDFRLCERHMPTRDGADDAMVCGVGNMLGSEAGGETNRRWCAAIHGAP